MAAEALRVGAKRQSPPKLDRSRSSWAQIVFPIRQTSLDSIVALPLERQGACRCVSADLQRRHSFAHPFVKANVCASAWPRVAQRALPLQRELVKLVQQAVEARWGSRGLAALEQRTLVREFVRAEEPLVVRLLEALAEERCASELTARALLAEMETLVLPEEAMVAEDARQEVADGLSATEVVGDSQRRPQAVELALQLEAEPSSVLALELRLAQPRLQSAAANPRRP